MHNPEPWRDSRSGETKCTGPIWNAMPSLVDRDGSPVAAIMPQNIDRIIACVNALAGIPTSLLTTGTRCQVAAALADLDLGSLPDKVKAALQTDTEDQ